MVTYLEEERVWVAHLPDSYADWLMSLSEAHGISVDAINLIATLTMCAVFGWFWQWQHSPVNRQLTSTTFSLIVLYALYGYYSFLAVISIITGAYLFFLTREVRLISFYAWAQLLLVHLYFWRYYYGSYRMDMSLTTMGLFIRLQFIAYDQQDMDDYRRRKPMRKEPEIRKFRMTHMLDRDLGFYDFFSYQVCFLHLFAGSNMPTMDYLRLINKRQFKDSGDSIPRAGPWSYLKLILKIALSFVLYNIFSKQVFSIDRVYEDWFSEYNAVSRSVYIWLCVLAVKQRYHFIWHLVELPILTSGAAYSGKDKDGNNRWERHKNIDSFKAEFGENFTQLGGGWNKTKNLWLKHYFAHRFEKKTSKLGKQLSTRIVNSLFNGICSGHFMFFSCTVVHDCIVTPVLDSCIGFSKDYQTWAEQSVIYLLRATLVSWFINLYGVSILWFQTEDWIELNNKMMWMPHIVIAVCALYRGFRITILDPALDEIKRKTGRNPFVDVLKVD